MKKNSAGIPTFKFVRNMDTSLRSAIKLAILVTLVKITEQRTACLTPNQQPGRCVPLNECNILKKSLHFAADSIEQSHCGFDIDHHPLVCCGTVGHPLNESNIRTKRAVEPNPKTSNLLPDRTICGLEREVEKLIGGRATGLDEFPWMALLRYKDDSGLDAGFKCGGTLINNRFVLTAAHCVLTSHQMFHLSGIRLGEWRLSTNPDCMTQFAIEECADPVIDVDIEEEIPHPYYNSRNGNNDVALLRMSRDITYTDFIRPICLPPIDLPSPEAGTLMTVCGWGAVENGSQSDVKLKLDLPLVSNTECIEKISSYTQISPNQICAGGVQGKDACRGDSGGPLMRTYADATSQWYQEGIVSRGKRCGTKNIPGVYTRVSRYVSWILNNIGSYNK